MENARWSVLRVVPLTQSITQAGWCHLLPSVLFQIFKMQPSFQNILQALRICREAFQSAHFPYTNYFFSMPTKMHIHNRIHVFLSTLSYMFRRLLRHLQG